jgi:hypothetical protein
MDKDQKPEADLLSCAGHFLIAVKLLCGTIAGKAVELAPAGNAM